MSLFSSKKPVPVKELIGKAFKGPTEIPDTGGKIYPRQEMVKTLKELLPFQKILFQTRHLKCILELFRTVNYEMLKMTKNDRMKSGGNLLQNCHHNMTSITLYKKLEQVVNRLYQQLNLDKQEKISITNRQNHFAGSL